MVNGGASNQDHLLMNNEVHDSTCLRYLILLLLFLAMVRLWFSASFDLIPDEAYYWSWSRHLDYCYFDQPGMIAFIEYLFVQLPGFTSAFMARLPIVVLSLACSVLMYLTSRNLFGNSINALFTVLFFNVAPMFWSGAFLVLHDGPLIFFWMMTLWLLSLFRLRNERIFLYLAALSITATIYCKFTGLFLVVGIVIYFLLSSEQRPLLRRFDFYICCLIVFVLFLPIIQWNMNNDWIAYKAVQKLGHRDNVTMAKQLDYFFSYHGSLLLLLSPLFFISLIMAMFRATRQWLASKNDSILFCLSFSLPVLVYFSVMTLKTRVQPNWSAMAFPAAFILLVEMAGRFQGTDRLSPRSLRLSRYWKSAVSVAVVLSMLISFHAMFHFIPLPEDIAQKDRTYKELYGWSELGQAVGYMRKNNEIIMALRYQIAAELEFYVPGQPLVYCMNAFGRGNQYDFLNDYSSLNGRTILIVSEKPIPAELAGKFERLEEPVTLDIKDKGKTVKSFLIYRGINFDAIGEPVLEGRLHI